MEIDGTHDPLLTPTPPMSLEQLTETQNSPPGSSSHFGDVKNCDKKKELKERQKSGSKKP